MERGILRAGAFGQHRGFSGQHSQSSLIQADASDRTRVEGAVGLPSGAAGHAVEEYLAVLDDAAFGAASEVTPKFIAPADPATRWTAAHRGPAFFAYSTNYLIDVDNAIMSMSRRRRRFAKPR